jgi:26S proteasome regulatory subunit N7
MDEDLAPRLVSSPPLISACLSGKDLAPTYEAVVSELGWELDAAKLAEMRGANEQHLAELAERIADAEKNLGDTEVREARLAKAEYLCKIGARLPALPRHGTINPKP